MRSPEPPFARSFAVEARPQWTRLSRPGLAALILQSATLLAMTATVATRVWQDHLWFGFALVGITLVVWAPEVRLRRQRLLWFGYVAGIFVYTLLRALADETFIPIRTEYVIRLDHWIPGRSPVQLLQEWRSLGKFGDWVDYFAVATHWSFFIVPHAGAVAVYFWWRHAFRPYVVLVVGTMWLGLVLFFVLPTSPPWLAGQQGELPGVSRVMDSTVREALAASDSEGGEETYDEFYQALGEPNSVAAMPSIHMAVTFAMFLWAWRYARRFAAPLLVYTIIMAAALVYLGEHYVADEVAGVACAVVVWLLVRRFVPARVADTNEPRA